MKDFKPTSFVGTAECHKTVIYDFYQLDFPGGPYSRHATCLTDDLYYASAQQDGASTCSESLTKLGIMQGGSYGLQRKVTVNFPMTAKQYTELNTTNPGTAVTAKLSVNPHITDGSPAVITLLNVVENLATIKWKRDSIFHSAINIYTAPAPTAQPTAGPTIEPTTAPSSSAPTTKPTAAPSSSAPTIKPTSSCQTVCLTDGIEVLEFGRFNN